MSYAHHEPDLGLRVLDNEEYLQRINSTIDIMVKQLLEQECPLDADGIVKQSIKIANSLDRQLSEQQSQRTKDLALQLKDLKDSPSSLFVRFLPEDGIWKTNDQSENPEPTENW